MAKRKKYTAKQKAQMVIELLKEEKSVGQISSEYNIHPNQLYRWKQQGLESFYEVFEDWRKQDRVRFQNRIRIFSSMNTVILNR